VATQQRPLTAHIHVKQQLRPVVDHNLGIVD
jgi:hypothetical protein